MHLILPVITVSTKKWPPKHALKFSKLASFAQFQFNSMNICLLSIKVPILVQICPTVIEILTFNKWSQKFTVSRSVISYLESMELTTSASTQLSHWQNKNKQHGV